MRRTIVGTGHRAGLAVAGCAALTILASAAVSGCSGPGSSATPPAFSPGTVSPTASSSASPTITPTATPSASPTITPTPTPSATPSPIPTAAPATGGGGTAGFQHSLLFGLGVAAILAGAGSIAYRRKVTRNRRIS
jgi:hypothetical protein